MDYFELQQYCEAKQDKNYWNVFLQVLQELYPGILVRDVKSAEVWRVQKEMLTRKKEQKDVKRYIYLVTFTLRPEITEEQYPRWRQYVKDALANPKFKPLTIDVSEELHKNGRPHIHGVCEFGVPMKKHKFNYHIKKFGNVDCERTKCGNPTNALEYICKSVTPDTVI